MTFKTYRNFSILVVVGLFCSCTGQFAALNSTATSASTASGVGGATTTNGGLTGGSASSGSTGSLNGATVNNMMTINMQCEYTDEPCVSVTICAPGSTTDCQTINNVLLDTGSYGLRLFSSVVTVAATPATNSAGADLGECVSYADGSGQWGQVEYVDIHLSADEVATKVPIHMINAAYATAPASCGNLDTSPATTGFNGILGVGLFAADCGAGCTTVANNGMYYACTGTTCTASTAPIASQVTNPVSMLSVDNNGVIMQLPSIAATGAANVTGTLYFGIGTRTNNTPTNVKTFTADDTGEFTTTYNGASYSSFIDSGSNGLYFPGSTITQCTGTYAGFFCPTATTAYTATQVATTGGIQGAVPFSIANTNTLVATNFATFNDIGAFSSQFFDWGLPFFLGRSVYVGIQGAKSTLGTGPYWAY